MRISTVVVLLASALLLASDLTAQAPAPPIPVAAQVRREVIRGRVTTESGVALPAVDIVATMAPNRDVFRTQTDEDGQYELVIASGTGDYLVHISAVGRRAFRRRIMGSGTDSVFVLDAQLDPAVTALATVTVQARRKQPARGRSFEAEPGASERLVDDVSGALVPDQQGDLAALAATVAGVRAVDDGISVLGLGPDQNQTTLNGMSFGSSELPRGAQTRTRVSTSAYDPARGGFSGALVDVELGSGGQFTRRTARLSLDAPALQAADPLARGLGMRLARLDLSVAGSGELFRDRFYFNTAAQLRRSSADVASLLDASADALRLAGVSADSSARMLQQLRTRGAPAELLGARAEPMTTSASVVARFNPPEYDVVSQRPAPSTWSVSTYGRLTRTDASGTSLTATPGRGARQATATVALLGEYSRFFRDSYLTTLRSAVTLASDRGTPYSQLPGGSVQVSSELDDGSLGAAALTFGGNGLLEHDGERWTWETVSETQFYADRRSHHAVKLYAQSRLDGFRQRPAADRYGLFSFSSLADLDANAPASFTRMLHTPEPAGGAWNGALALGDHWRPTRAFSLLYGARLEGNAFTSRPEPNPATRALFGARTEVAPATLGLSPRLGFTWTYTARARSASMLATSLGTFYTAPRGQLRGGIGEFRGLPGPSLLAGAMTNTGLPGSARRLHCVGDAVPTPDWTAYAASPAALPAACAGGTTAFADVAPAVELFAASYAPPRSWRANLAWSSAYKKIGFTFEGLYSWNLDQAAVVDLNFAGVPRFTLAEEGGRPVYVGPTAIVAATGVVAPGEARREAGFASVLSRRSDNRSLSRQLTVTLAPELPSSRYVLRTAYTLASTRARMRGFDGAAFGDPWLREWARGAFDVRHQVQLQAGVAARGLTLTTFGLLSSGVPYTPVINGDVNGDGRGGDRAFIFDPARTADPALAEGMRNHLAQAPAQARDCLQRQLDQPARRNECEGPWALSLNAQLSVPGRALRLGDRASISLYAQNPLGGLDRLLHGRGLRGWGATPRPDPVLYTVRGFDATAQRFRYEVNPRFGSTGSSRSTFRVPFRVTLDVTIDLSRPLGEQQLDRWLGQGRGRNPGVRLNADSLVQRYRRTVLDPYAALLRETDSLLLSVPQVEELKRRQATYLVRIDSVWRELAVRLDGLGGQYDLADALRRQEEDTDRAWAVAWQEVKALDTVLLPIQLRLMPSSIRVLYRMERAPQGIRRYYAG